MNTWIILTITYALCSGIFECAKKEAVKKSSIYEVLACFSTLAFIFVAFTNTDALLIDVKYIPIILIKSIFVLLAWLLGMYVISKMAISTYSITKISQIIFTVLMSCIILGDKITIKFFIGLVIVIIGLVLVNTISSDKKNKAKTSLNLTLILLLSCFFNSCSEIFDKKILMHITSTQLQFWFLLILTISYWILFIIKQKKINIKNIIKNYWILIAAIALTVGDRCLFIANNNPDSKVSVMTILKQISVIESIILGKFIFKEQNILKKIMCSIIVILGIVIIIF